VLDERIGDNVLIDDVKEIGTPMNCGWWGKPERSCIEPLRLLVWRDAGACARTTQQDH
jgi:hypothetical protein